MARKVDLESEKKGGRDAKVKSQHQTCAFPTLPEEVLIGISVSEGTISRAKPILASWSGRIHTVFLGAKPHKGFDIMITGVNRDDYRSTLGKGFLGLVEMYKKYPDKKWYGLLDDDCFCNANGLVTALSAFDSTQPWSFSQSGFAKSNWRLFGGAGIIISHGMLREMSPHLTKLVSVPSSAPTEPDDSCHVHTHPIILRRRGLSGISTT